jgi:hypothetical protein
VTVLASAGAVLASTSTNSTSTINDVEPGLLGFLVVAALGVALVFLLRSMNKQFKKIGPKPEDEDTAVAGAADEGDAKPLRGLAAHRAAMAAAAKADAEAEADAKRG